MFGALTTLGNFDMIIVEHERGGSVVRPGDEHGSAFHVDGRTLTSRVWGFSAQAPEGFDWEQDVPSWTSGLVARGRRNDGASLTVRAHPVGYDFTPDQLADVLGGSATISIPTKVDGRKGLVTNAKPWSLLAWDGDTVLEWSLRGLDDEEALEALLGMARAVDFGED